MDQNGHGALDIVGVGALNLDYIVDDTAVGAVRAELGEFERGTETAVGAGTIDAVLNRLDPAVVTASPGGSAFNTVHALTHLRRRLRLGYVGVAGRTPTPGNSPVHQLEVHGVDTTAVARTDEMLCGVCVSLQQGPDRTLLTHAGANELLADVIEDHFDEVLAYLSRARIVHVTSFLDPATSAQLLRLLGRLRQVHPSVLISFDPGHVWATQRSPVTLGIVRLVDVLMVNAREFRELSRAAATVSDVQAARQIMAGMDRADAMLLVKQPAGVVVFRGRDDHVTDELFGARPPLRDDQIRDSTGAGDVFAAGVLAALAGSPQQLHLGVRLGLVLAGHKMRHVGAAGHPGFADLARKVLPD